MHRFSACAALVGDAGELVCAVAAERLIVINK